MSDSMLHSRRLLREQLLDNLEEHRRHAEQTGNPVYVWRGLAEWFVFDESRDPQAEERSELPDWILRSLSIWARRMRDLSEGKDYRIAPSPLGDLPSELSSVERASRRQRTLEPTAAAKLVLHALGLRRLEGWNAFRQAQRLEQEELTELTYATYREIGGERYHQALKMVLDDHDEVQNRTQSEQGTPTDERTIRRQIASARKARRAKPP